MRIEEGGAAGTPAAAVSPASVLHDMEPRLPWESLVDASLLDWTRPLVPQIRILLGQI